MNRMNKQTLIVAAERGIGGGTDSGAPTPVGAFCQPAEVERDDFESPLGFYTFV